MAKKLCFILILSMFLLIIEFTHSQEDSPSPVASQERETLADSPLSPSSSPEAGSLQPPVSSPEPDSPPPPPPPQPESPSAPSPSPSPSSSSSLSPGPAPVSAPSDEDSDNDPEQETEYFPSPTPTPAPEIGKPDDIKASEEGDEEFEEERGEDNGMSGLAKAGIAIGAIFGVGAIVIGALVYKKRRDNLTRARYTYFTQGDFL